MPILLLHARSLLLLLDDRRLEARQRLAPGVAGVHLGGQPALGALVAGEHLDEVRARHLRLVRRTMSWILRSWRRISSTRPRTLSHRRSTVRAVKRMVISSAEIWSRTCR